MIKNEYIMKDENGNYFFNDMLPKLELMNFKIEKQIYRSGVQIIKNYATNNILIAERKFEKLENTIKKVSKKISFKEAYLKYSELSKGFVLGDQAAEIAKIQPLVVEAYNKLGDDMVKKLRYIKNDIEKALMNCDKNKSQLEKVGAILMKSITYPTVETCSRLIELIGEAYQIVGIEKKAKAADITKWFECKKTSAKINGVTTAVYKIYTPKQIIIND
jgi:hypothetical protein